MISTKNGVKLHLWLKPPKYSKIMAIPHSKKKFPSPKTAKQRAMVFQAPSGSRTSIGHCAIAVAEGNAITDPESITALAKKLPFLVIGARDSHQGQPLQQAMQVLNRMSPSQFLLARVNVQFTYTVLRSLHVAKGDLHCHWLFICFRWICIYLVWENGKVFVHKTHGLWEWDSSALQERLISNLNCRAVENLSYWREAWWSCFLEHHDWHQEWEPVENFNLQDLCRKMCASKSDFGLLDGSKATSLFYNTSTWFSSDYTQATTLKRISDISNSLTWDVHAENCAFIAGQQCTRNLECKWVKWVKSINRLYTCKQ